MIWDLHAKFLTSQGTTWRAYFSPMLDWSHPDYPLLVPATVAISWILYGQQNPLLPVLVGFIFTYGLVGLFFSALIQNVKYKTAVLSTCLLLCVPTLFFFGAIQYADIPLSFAYLSAIIILISYIQQGMRSEKSLILLGLVVGMAAWTKNEGFCFIIATTLALALLAFKTSKKKLLYYAIGLLPIFVLVLIFKYKIAAVPNDLFVKFSIENYLQLIMDPSRYRLILEALGNQFLHGGGGIIGIIPMIIVVTIILGMNSKIGSLPSKTAIGILAFTFIQYLCIYIITPHDLEWHLNYSLDRLILQLLPSAWFVISLSLGREEKKVLSVGEMKS
jgi:4-amino-4-deoxy-L-arabinose transferase-like glycosyltransferase